MHTFEIPFSCNTFTTDGPFLSCNSLPNRKKYRTFLGCNSVSNIDKRWSLCELQLAFGQTKPHPIKLLLYYFPYGVHPYCTDNTDNINLHNAPLARMSVCLTVFRDRNSSETTGFNIMYNCQKYC